MKNKLLNKHGEKYVKLVEEKLKKPWLLKFRVVRLYVDEEENKEMRHHLRVADRERKKKNWDKAINRYEKVFKSYPGAVPEKPYYKAAVAYRMKGDLESSENILLEGLFYFPGSFRLAIEYAELKRRNEDWKSALEAWKRVYCTSEEMSRFNYKRFSLAAEKAGELELHRKLLLEAAIKFSNSLVAKERLEKAKENGLSTTPDVVDAVITWVDGSDESHARLRRYYKNKLEGYSLKLDKNATSEKRFFDNKELLYCLRSIKKNAPWIRNIWIVADKQRPSYIDEDIARDSNIYFIDHSVIFRGAEELLPIFNSISIETMIWRIPGLSDNFIYFNDDMFLASETKVHDFFIGNKPILRGRWLKSRIDKKVSMYGNGVINGARLSEIGDSDIFSMAHFGQVMKKSIIKELYEKMLPYFFFNAAYKFRSSDQFLLQSLHHNYAINNGFAVKRDSEDSIIINEVLYGERNIGDMYEVLKNLNKYKQCCINNVGPEFFNLMKPYFEKEFGGAMPYEV